MIPKPTQFSDPYYDWDTCEEQLTAILSKEAADLVVEDYQVIFARHLPAANYLEGLYYLPLCLDFISKGRDVHTTRYPDSLLWWIHNYKADLEADGLWLGVLGLVKDTCLSIFSTFELFDLSEEQCASLGRDFGYSISPVNQHTAHDLIDDLTIWPEFADIVACIITHIRDFNSVSYARWYVELAFHSRIWCLLYDPDTELDNYKTKEALFHELHAFRYLQEAQEIAREATYKEGKFKYNRLVLL